MIKEENLLLRKYGRKSHFSVPDGYFGHLTDQVLGAVSEDAATSGSTIAIIRPKSRFVALWHHVALRRVAIAASIAIILGLGTWKVVAETSATPQSAVAQHHVEATSQSGDSSFDEAADYTMLDNQDIYVSLLSESNGF